MNKEEFKELQDETAFYLFNIESMQKRMYITDLKYNYYFYDMLKEKISIENEINCIRGMIENKNRNLNYNEFKKAFIKKMKESDENVEAKHNQTLLIFDAVTNQPKEDLDKIEAYFKTFVREHHPVVLYNKNKEAAMSYDFVKKMYRENNYNGMVEAYNLNKASFNADPIFPNSYNEVALLYYEFKKNVTTNFMKISDKEYPKNKIMVFETPDGIEKEKEQLKKDTENLLAILVPLQKDYEQNFGEKFSFDLN